MKALRMRLTIWWCRQMHPEAMWPSHGHYRCRQCGRLFAAPWETGQDDSIERSLTAAAQPRSRSMAPAAQAG